MKVWNRSISCVGFAHHKPFKAANSRFCCSDCRCSFDDPRVKMAPILQDRVWRRLAPNNEPLCSAWMFKRATSRGIRLTLADLWPCLFNLQNAPFSWFELYAADEPAPPKNLSQWRDALQGLSPHLVRWTMNERA